MQDYFDANQVQPAQGGGSGHPVGMHNVVITNTYCKPTSDNNGLMFIAEFTSQVGKIENRYNIFNQNAQAQEIAHKELSALCHATGRLRLSWPKLPDGNLNMQMAGAELRGANLRIEVAPQIDRKTKEPNGYVEVKKVYDSNGNEPGKAPAPQGQQQPQGGAPMQQQSNGGWGTTQQQQPSAPPPPPPPVQEQQPQWGNPPANQPNPNPAPQTGNAGGWTPPNQAPAGNKPPWA